MLGKALRAARLPYKRSGAKQGVGDGHSFSCPLPNDEEHDRHAEARERREIGVGFRIERTVLVLELVPGEFPRFVVMDTHVLRPLRSAVIGPGEIPGEDTCVCDSDERLALSVDDQFETAILHKPFDVGQLRTRKRRKHLTQQPHVKNRPAYVLIRSDKLNVIAAKAATHGNPRSIG